jgi:threonine/homoserine/homoserine lactone efflux protein
VALDASHLAAAFGLGVALGASPGPVQLLLLSESSRGGVFRGLRAMAGANLTFGAMLALLAAGLSSIQPSDTFLRIVRIVGGAFLLWLAVDALRESRRPHDAEAPRPTLHPSIRGIVAVLANPGVYVFLATTGAAIVAAAVDDGGRPRAFLTVVALLAGVSAMDSGMVLIGAGARRASEGALRTLATFLALALAALGLWLVVQGVVG